MDNQKKAIVNYSTLLKALTRYQGIDGYSKGAAKQFAKNLNAEIKKFQGYQTVYWVRIGDNRLRTIYSHCKQCPDVKYVIFDYFACFANSRKDYEERVKPFNDLGVKVKFMFTQIPNLHDSWEHVVNLLAKENHGKSNRGDSQL